ncbi:hypothetical protein GGR56DRAFT_191730 [Xylariaceae sp. FL0804]|nr:hypothetical protein GGR56DRAFT_191730 [Xylariaceae sp. FL0804]
MAYPHPAPRLPPLSLPTMQATCGLCSHRINVTSHKILSRRGMAKRLVFSTAIAISDECTVGVDVRCTDTSGIDRMPCPRRGKRPTRERFGRSSRRIRPGPNPGYRPSSRSQDMLISIHTWHARHTCRSEPCLHAATQRRGRLREAVRDLGLSSSSSSSSFPSSSSSSSSSLIVMCQHACMGQPLVLADQRLDLTGSLANGLCGLGSQSA